MCQCFLSGIKNADENELRSIASEPDQIHMYNVIDFKFLMDIVDDVTNNLCNSVKGPGITVRLAPLGLESIKTSKETSDTWETECIFNLEFKNFSEEMIVLF